eukprot:6209499-Pleurochrysis_carterae.AAC.4
MAGVPRTQRAVPLSSQVNVTDPDPSLKSASPTAVSAATLGVAAAARAADPDALCSNQQATAVGAASAVRRTSGRRLDSGENALHKLPVQAKQSLGRYHVVIELRSRQVSVHLRRCDSRWSSSRRSGRRSARSQRAIACGLSGSGLSARHSWEYERWGDRRWCVECIR